MATVFCASLFALPVRGAEDGEIGVFLQRYCVQCHGPEEQKADRRFDSLGGSIQDDDMLVDYQDIVDQLNLGEMPPEEARQPTIQERKKVVRRATSLLARYRDQHKGSSSRTMLRRLNAREYRNTVRDLLHLDMSMFDPTARFPRDQTTEHLDNIGETLVTSGYLLARYLEAADSVIDRALLPLERPPVQTWTFRDDFRQQPEIDQVHRKTNGFDRITLYDDIGADKHEGAYGPILNFADGVPFDGIYEIRLNAAAVNRLHPYDPEFLGTDPSEPLRLGIVAGNRDVGNLHLPQPIEPLLAEIELADQTQWYTVRVNLDAGYTPRFTFRNGLMDVRNLWARLIRKYPDQFPKGSHKGIVSARFNAIKHGKLPQIHIHQVEIEGPHYDQWPRESQRVLLGDDCCAEQPISDSMMRDMVERFARRAYRRPPGNKEVDRILQVIQERETKGRSRIEAYADGVKAILCSPNFLYLDTASGDQLTTYGLASRLSYFLWSSMPDQELIELAETDRLRHPDVLRRQVYRMLRDERSDALVNGFLGSWLGLRELGATPPDRGDFREFYHYDLDSAMRRETFLFTRHLIDQNLSLDHFLDARFTFLNKPLARLYDLPPPPKADFQFVQLDDRRRGGLLGQASILTLTANGIDTSPVVRGVWLLENLLGTPPSPPPPDVEPLDPDTRGATTIREQLEKHRDNPSCKECHRKIDPLGFALENFDPIGRWRQSYGRDDKIDASGMLPGRRKFDDVVEFKSLLLEQNDQFARAFTTKLLAYATGRHLTPRDRPQIDKILQSTKPAGYRAHDLIEQVVTSEMFRQP